MKTAAVDLYWIPLGAGGHWRAALRARLRGGPGRLAAPRRCDLYHAALTVDVDGVRHTIELAPSPDSNYKSRGVIATGPVGSRNAGRLRLFRYELRCWAGGYDPGSRVRGRRPAPADDRPARAARRVLDAGQA